MSANRDANTAQTLQDEGRVHEESSESKIPIGLQSEAEDTKQWSTVGPLVETVLGRSAANAIAIRDTTNCIAAVGSIPDEARLLSTRASMLTDIGSRFELNPSVLVGGVVQRLADLNLLSSRASALSVTVISSSAASHFAQSDGFSDRAAALRSAQTLCGLGIDRLAGLATAADLTHIGALNTTGFHGGVMRHFADLDGFSGRAAALISEVTLDLLGTDRFAALRAASDSARLGTTGAMLSRGFAHHFAELTTFSDQAAALNFADTLVEPFGDQSRDFPHHNLLSPPSSLRLVKPCPLEPLIVCAKCGGEMVILRVDPGDVENRSLEVIRAYPQCVCVVMDLATEFRAGVSPLPEGHPARKRRKRVGPSWFHGAIKGGRLGDGIRAGAAILHVVPRSTVKPGA